MTSDAVRLFREHFGRTPDLAASAPGRVNLIGEHTDYNGGPVLPIAITRRTTVVVARAEGWRFISRQAGPAVDVDLMAPLRGDWTDYLVGVARELRDMGAAPAGASVAVSSTVPIGAGLSSSAALTVSATRALSALAGRRLAPRVIAEVAYRAEHGHVGVRCGRMDQTIAALGRAGHALLFETGSGAITELPMPWRIGVIETGVSHQLTGGELNERRRECEEALRMLQRRWPDLASLAALPAAHLAEAGSLLGERLAGRVRHVVTETGRTRRAASLLVAADLPRFGALLVEGHRSLQHEYDSSVPEADFIVDRALERGAAGARLTGAGWGGAVLVLVPPEAERPVLRGVISDFAARFGRRPAAWTTRAAGGLRRERIFK